MELMEENGVQGNQFSVGGVRRSIVRKRLAERCLKVQPLCQSARKEIGLFEGFLTLGTRLQKRFGT